jgi:hypothetical protein
MPAEQHWTALGKTSFLEKFSDRFKRAGMKKNGLGSRGGHPSTNKLLQS